ncbi:MAG: hypothetical protein GXP45_01265 [bacterium]|nr:hypothetical protein [bacterium]
MDKPKADQKKSRAPVATLLGIFLLIGFVLTIAIVFPEYLHNRIFWGLVVAGVIIAIPAIIDELHYLGYSRLDIPPWLRLITQIIASVLAIAVSGIHFANLGILGKDRITPQRIFR